MNKDKGFKMKLQLKKFSKSKTETEKKDFKSLNVNYMKLKSEMGHKTQEN